MLKRTPIILLSTLLIMLVILFAAARARAFSQPDGNCTAQEKMNYECFISAGYLVEIVPDAEGNFPQNVNGNSVFKYRIKKINATKKLTLVDILIPNDSTPKVEIISSSPGGKLFTNGKGGPITNFGQWLTLDNTWWWNYSGWPPLAGQQISLTVKGIVGAEHNAMLLGTTSIYPSDFGNGEILAPGGRPLQTIAASQCINLFESETEKLSMSVRRTNDSCIIENSVRFYRSASCTGEPLAPTFIDPSLSFVYNSGTFGGCPELVKVTKSSPVCVELTLKSGRKTQVCY